MRLRDLQRSLGSVVGLKGSKFAFAVAKNSGKIKSELMALQEVISKIDGLKDYDEERNKINTEYAKLSLDDKKPTKEQTEANMQFIADLDKKYEKSINEWKEVMEEEIEFAPHMIKLDNLPEDINAAQIEGIIEIIDEQ